MYSKVDVLIWGCGVCVSDVLAVPCMVANQELPSVTILSVEAVYLVWDMAARDRVCEAQKGVAVHIAVAVQLLMSASHIIQRCLRVLK